MKKYLFSFLLISSFLTNSQQKLLSSGGTVAGSGSLNYSVGQVFFSTNSSNSGSFSESIHQAIELFSLSTSDKNIVFIKAKTYPNPTKNKITLALKDIELNNLTYTVFDANGRLIIKGKVLEEDTDIYMKNYAKGIYFLKVNQNQKQLDIFKIIKH
jgi:hypothetical protein